MRRLAPHIGLLLALVLAGCGSATRGPGSTVAVVPPGTVSTARPSTATTTAAPATTATRDATTRTPPASTTPQSLPQPKHRRGPRKLSVAESSRPIESSGGRSAARQLVEAWRHGPVPASDADVALVQRHLSSLDGKCSESEAQIAGYIRAGIERYRSHGVLESPVEFARALDSATPPGRSHCKGILRTLLAQVEQG